jgi:hypothetical protein
MTRQGGRSFYPDQIYSFINELVLQLSTEKNGIKDWLSFVSNDSMHGMYIQYANFNCH